MSKPLPPSPYWIRTTSIPIQLEVSDMSQVERHDESTGRVCSTCEVNSSNQPIHCIQASPAPPSYNSVVHPSTNHLAVPGPFQYGLPRPRPPRPALRFDKNTQPRVRFRRAVASPLSACTTIYGIDTDCQAKTTGSSLPNTPQDDNEARKIITLGLGIPDAPFHPDPSPIRSPASEILASAEKGQYSNKSAFNVAQRIEQKLLEYSHSGNVAKRWLLEIISWTISAMCMGAIVIVLWNYSGKPPPGHWPLDITLNAYISTVSKIASAALLLPASEAIGQLKWNWFQGDSKKMWDFEIFDNATRGPWGSFLLLLRTKGTTLAALGAAITIFSLALDPFFQQVVDFPTSWVQTTLNGSVTKVTRYSPLNFHPFTIWEPQLSPNVAMNAVIQQYFYDFGPSPVKAGNTTRPDFPVSCPFGNCTWEPYESLGFCSECADVADMLEYGCYMTPMDWNRNSTSWVTYYPNATMCGWFFNATSDKPMLMSGYVVDNLTNQSSEILTTRHLPLLTVMNKRPLFQGSIHFKHVRQPIADFVVVTPAVGSTDKQLLDSIFRGDRPRATECVIAMCVKRYESSYHSNLQGYTENVTNHWINTTVGPFPWSQVKINDPNITDAVEYFYYQDIAINPAQVDKDQNRTQNASHDNSFYGVSNDTANNIIRAFDDFLPSFGVRESNDSTTYMKYQIALQWPIFREYTINPWLPPYNVTDHVEKLANSLTNTMRLVSNETVYGTASNEETLVSVRWPWLSLPAGLLVMTLVFLVATIVRTSGEKNEVGIWKNSAIANIIFGLPENHKQRLLASAGGKDTPRTKAKTLHVRMLPTKDWRISGHAFSPNPQVEKPTQKKNGNEKSKYGPPPGWV